MKNRTDDVNLIYYDAFVKSDNYAQGLIAVRPCRQYKSQDINSNSFRFHQNDGVA